MLTDLKTVPCDIPDFWGCPRVQIRRIVEVTKKIKKMRSLKVATGG